MTNAQRRYWLANALQTALEDGKPEAEIRAIAAELAKACDYNHKG